MSFFVVCMLVVIALFLGWLYTHMLLAEPLVSPYPFWIFPMFADTFIWNLEPRVLQTEGGNSVPGTSLYIDTYIYTYTALMVLPSYTMYITIYIYITIYVLNIYMYINTYIHNYIISVSLISLSLYI